jgi:hypothetical protein
MRLVAQRMTAGAINHIGVILRLPKQLSKKLLSNAANRICDRDNKIGVLSTVFDHEL